MTSIVPALFFLVPHLIILCFLVHIVLPVTHRIPTGGLISPYLEHLCIIQACGLVKCILDIKVFKRNLTSRLIVLYHRAVRICRLIQAAIRSPLVVSMDMVVMFRASRLGFIDPRAGSAFQGPSKPLKSPSVPAKTSSPQTSASLILAVEANTITSPSTNFANDTPKLGNTSPPNLRPGIFSDVHHNTPIRVSPPTIKLSFSSPKTESPPKARPAAVSTVPFGLKSKSKFRLKSRSIRRSRGGGNSASVSIKRLKKISTQGSTKLKRVHWAGVDRYKSLVEKLKRFEVEVGLDGY